MWRVLEGLGVRRWQSGPSAPAGVELDRVPSIQDKAEFEARAEADRFYAVGYLRHQIEAGTAGNARVVIGASMGWFTALTVALLAWLSVADDPRFVHRLGVITIAAVLFATAALFTSLVSASRADSRRAYARAWLEVLSS
jgi:hypothetical protein